MHSLRLSFATDRIGVHSTFILMQSLTHPGDVKSVRISLEVVARVSERTARAYFSLAVDHPTSSPSSSSSFWLAPSPAAAFSAEAAPAVPLGEAVAGGESGGQPALDVQAGGTPASGAPVPTPTVASSSPASAGGSTGATPFGDPSEAVGADGDSSSALQREKRRHMRISFGDVFLGERVTHRFFTIFNAFTQPLDFSLSCHQISSTGSAQARGLVRVPRAGGELLIERFPGGSDVPRLREAMNGLGSRFGGNPREAIGLWQHTCDLGSWRHGG